MKNTLKTLLSLTTLFAISGTPLIQANEPVVAVTPNHKDAIVQSLKDAGFSDEAIQQTLDHMDQAVAQHAPGIDSASNALQNVTSRVVEKMVVVNQDGKTKKIDTLDGSISSLSEILENLKLNDGSLPITVKKGGSVTVIGPDGNTTTTNYGDELAVEDLDKELQKILEKSGIPNADIETRITSIGPAIRLGADTPFNPSLNAEIQGLREDLAKQRELLETQQKLLETLITKVGQ